MLKERFGEFDAHPDPTKAGALTIDPAWVQTHIASEDLPVLHTVTCDTEVLDLLRRAMNQLASAGHASDVSSAGTCYDPVADPTDPDGPLTAKAFGAAIELNRGTNVPGDRPGADEDIDRNDGSVGIRLGGSRCLPTGSVVPFPRAVRAETKRALFLGWLPCKAKGAGIRRLSARAPGAGTTSRVLGHASAA